MLSARAASTAACSTCSTRSLQVGLHDSWYVTSAHIAPASASSLALPVASSVNVLLAVLEADELTVLDCELEPESDAVELMVELALEVCVALKEVDTVDDPDELAVDGTVPDMVLLAVLDTVELPVFDCVDAVTLCVLDADDVAVDDAVIETDDDADVVNDEDAVADTVAVTDDATVVEAEDVNVLLAVLILVVIGV